MAIVQKFVNQGEPIKDRYNWDGRFITPTEEIYNFLIQWRKDTIKNQDENRALMNKYEDREIKKLYKILMNAQLKVQRAITLMLPWFGQGDKNQTAIMTDLWPLDLVEELDYVTGVLILKFQ